MELPIPSRLPPDLHEAYLQAAERNVLRALNPGVFFGYFSVCADGQGHGGNTTYPGLDWGQSAEALLWLGRGLVTVIIGLAIFSPVILIILGAIWLMRRRRAKAS